MNIPFTIVFNVGHEGLVLGLGCMVTLEVNGRSLGAFGGRRKLCLILALLLLQVEYFVLLILLD